jgi:hypothetical protein
MNTPNFSNNQDIDTISLTKHVYSTRVDRSRVKHLRGSIARRRRGYCTTTQCKHVNSQWNPHPVQHNDLLEDDDVATVRDTPDQGNRAGL